MTHQNDRTALEKILTERLAQLPVPIHLTWYIPTNGGYWYLWKTLPAGAGECGTFEAAVIEAITYQQEQQQAQQLSATRFSATPGRYTPATLSTLGACLRQTHKARPTAALFLYLGDQGWLESKQAHEMVAKSRLIDLSWDAYLEDEQGPDPAGIYLFGSDGGAYRGFDVEMEAA